MSSEHNVFRKLNNVPKLPNHFISRETVSLKIKKLLKNNEINGLTSATAKIGIYGMAGKGKSVVAAAIANDEQVQELFIDGIYWITLGYEPAITVRQAQLAKALGDNLSSFADSQDGRSKLSDLLRGKNCLIVLDDVWKVDHIEAFNVLEDSSVLLFTTRDQGIVLRTGADEVSLELLTLREALLLLSKWVNRDKNDLPSEANDIVSETGRLPLALAMIGATLRSTPNRWSNILTRLRNSDLEKIKQDFPNYPYPTLFKAIQVSLDVLDYSIRTRYLDFALFVEDEPVPECVIVDLWKNEGVDEQDAVNTVDLLVERSLLQRNESYKLTLHDLQFDYVRKESGNIISLHNRLIAMYTAKSSNGWHRGPNDGYFFQKLIYHLFKADRILELKSLLVDLQWLKAKLESTDINDLLLDFDYISDPDIKLIQETLRLSAHILIESKEQLRGQLLGRLLGTESPPHISNLLNQCNQIKGLPWLSPLCQDLTSPGNALLYTVQANGGISSIINSLDGKYFIFSSSMRGKSSIKFWDLEKKSLYKELPGNDTGITGLVMSLDGSKLVAGTNSGFIQIWDLTSFEEIFSFSCQDGPINALALTPDAKYVLTGTKDRTLKVWELNTGKLIKFLIGHSERIFSIAISKDGKRAISGDLQGAIKVWDLESYTLCFPLLGHQYHVRAILISQDKFVIAGSDDSTIKVWNLANGKLLRTLRGHDRWVCSLAVSSDGSKLVSGGADNKVIMWDLASGNLLGVFKEQGGSINDVTFSADNTKVISGSGDSSIKVWEINKITTYIEPIRHTKPIYSVVVSPNNRNAISASEDSTIKIWNLEDGKLVYTLRGHYSGVRIVTFTPDGNKIISRSNDGAIKIWDLENKRLLREISTGPVQSLAVSPNKDYAILGFWDKPIEIWNLNPCSLRRRFNSPLEPVHSIAIAPDQTKMAFEVNSLVIKIWELPTGREMYSFKQHNNPTRKLIITPNSKFLISASDWTIKVRDLTSGELVHELTKHSKEISEVIITPDSSRLISAAYDGLIITWDLRTGSVLNTLNGFGHRLGQSNRR